VVAAADPTTLLRALQESGLSPVVEGADGRVHTVARRPPRRATTASAGGTRRWVESRAGQVWTAPQAPGPGPRAVVRRLRAAEAEIPEQTVAQPLLRPAETARRPVTGDATARRPAARDAEAVPRPVAVDTGTADDV